MSDTVDDVLEHVGLFRLTTIDATHRLFYGNRTRDAARIALLRLSAAGQLSRFEIRNRAFYRLTGTSCRQLGLPPSAARPFEAQGLLDRYATLGFCCLREKQREKLTLARMRELFPAVAGKPGADPLKQPYYLDLYQGVPRLGRILVDYGSDMGDILSKARHLAEEGRRGPLAPLLRDQAYVLAILTPHETKKARLVEAVTRRPFGLLVRVEAIPEMKHVL